MYMMLVYIVVPFVTLYFALKLFMERENAMHYTIATAVVLVVSLLVVAVCLGMAMMFETASYFREMKPSFWLFNAYEDFAASRKVMGWYLLYPYVFAANMVTVIFQLLFGHFRWYFFFPIWAGVYILRVWFMINQPMSYGVYTDEEHEQFANQRAEEDRREAENARFEEDAELDAKLRRRRR